MKHWQNDDMALRWTAAGMLEAERQFRRVIGHAELATLAVAVERDLKRACNADTRTRSPSMPAEQPATLDRRTITGAATPKFHGDRDILEILAYPGIDYLLGPMRNARAIAAQ